jgi:death-on-curing protein
MIHYLTVDDILGIRDHLAAASVAAGDADRYAVRSFPGLLSAVAAPERSAFGAVFYPTLEEKAAALVYALVQHHPFWDGNKRIASAALRLFAQRNGVQLTIGDGELKAFTTEIARGALRDGAVATWVAAHIREVRT